MWVFTPTWSPAARNPTGTNSLQIFVCGSGEQVMLCARLDNLGKGASGAAVQNMNIMLGLDEGTRFSRLWAPVNMSKYRGTVTTMPWGKSQMMGVNTGRRVRPHTDTISGMCLWSRFTA